MLLGAAEFQKLGETPDVDIGVVGSGQEIVWSGGDARDGLDMARREGDKPSRARLEDSQFAFEGAFREKGKN